MTIHTEVQASQFPGCPIFKGFSIASLFVPFPKTDIPTELAQKSLHGVTHYTKSVTCGRFVERISCVGRCDSDIQTWWHVPPRATAKCSCTSREMAMRRCCVVRRTLDLIITGTPKTEGGIRMTVISFKSRQSVVAHFLKALAISVIWAQSWIPFSTSCFDPCKFNAASASLGNQELLTFWLWDSCAMSLCECTV